MERAWFCLAEFAAFALVIFWVHRKNPSKRRVAIWPLFFGLLAFFGFWLMSRS